MTAVSQRRGSSPVIWIALFVVAAGIVALAFFGRNDRNLGGRADPGGFGREGLAALVEMIERTGGTAERGVDFPDPNHDVAVLPGPAYQLAVAFGADEDEVHRPILEWVADGGTLVTGVDLPGAPAASFSTMADGEIDRDVCTIDTLAGLETIVVASDYAPAEAEPGDSSCFGDGETAIVVSRPVGSGSIVRVAGFEPFFNQVLDEGDNGALAATILGMAPGRAVAFLAGPPPSVGAGGPVDDDGNPIGSGDESLLDLVPTRVTAMLVGLALAGLLYALARGRRLGSPVLEPLPIELPSSSYTEAVGRLYARTDDPRRHSAEILRHDFRASAARRIGLASDAPTAELAEALSITTGIDRARIVEILDGEVPASEEGLVELARALSENRLRLRRGASTVRERIPT